MITLFTCISFQQNNIRLIILKLIGNILNVAQNPKKTIILKQQGWIVKWSIALCSWFKGDASEYTCQLQRLRRMQLEEIGQEIGGKETFLYRQNNSISFIFPLSSIQSVLKDTVMLRTVRLQETVKCMWLDLWHLEDTSDANKCVCEQLARSHT